MFRFAGACDGFVAFLNGYEIGRSDNLSEFGTVAPFDATTEYDHEASLYSGGYPEEIIIDSIALSEILSNGENVFSVQVHNVGASSSDMSANFFQLFPKPLLTKDQLRLLRYDNIPSGKYKTNFEINLPSKKLFLNEVEKYCYMWREGGQFSTENYQTKK